MVAMGEEDWGGLPDPDPDLSKNWGGLPDPDPDLSKNRGGLPDLDLDPTRFLSRYYPPQDISPMPASATSRFVIYDRRGFIRLATR